MGIRVPHWLRKGQSQGPFYQYYATIHPFTCDVCLGHHGEIYARSGDAPQLPLHSSCRCAWLEIPVAQLGEYQERGLRMKEKAKREFQRRRLFSQASETLSRASVEEALPLFQHAVNMDVYLEEIETLCREQSAFFLRWPEHALKLRDLFLKAYGMKFEAEKYQPMTEGMKNAQRAHGLNAIQELFQEQTGGA